MGMPDNYRGGSQSNQRDASLKSLRSSADGNNRQQSFVFNAKQPHRKVKKTSTNRAIDVNGNIINMNNTQPLSLVGFSSVPQ